MLLPVVGVGDSIKQLNVSVGVSEEEAKGSQLFMV